jgi:GNAT superfamily N-acetyltransferase
VAESGASGVVGLALLGETDKVDPDIAARYAHELRSLQVNPAWQRQGVGRRLLARVGREVRRKGATHLLVAVLAENPNRAFYEHLGAVQLGARPYVWEGYETEEILYGWNDVQRQLT